MDIQKIKAKILDEFYDKLKIVSGTLEEEQQRQDFLQNICQRLIGDEIDFERYPVYFCIVDDQNPNAAFIPPKRAVILDPIDKWGNTVSDEEIKEAAREQYPTIFVTKGLLEMVENQDQLAYILGHELGHLRQDFLLKEHDNSKMEEITSDLNSLDMMAKAGFNINEARKIASHIFSNEQIYDSLKQMLARALDEHPNNESRLNAIDIKIKTIEDDYQKQNININDFEISSIPEQIIQDYSSNRYVSFFEKELKELKYYEVPLSQRQEILLSYLQDITERKEFWRKGDYLGGKLLKSYYQSALNKIVYSHIADLRKEMPRRIIKQSDAILFKSWLGYQEREDNLEKWIQVVGKEYCKISGSEFHMPDGQMERVAILDSFRFKIVPDEEYETQVAIEEAKRKDFQRQLDEGTNLSLQFWDNILQMGNYENYASLAINCLENIDLSKTTIGKFAIEEIENILKSNSIYFAPARNLEILQKCYYNFSAEEELPADMRLRYLETFARFFYRFNPESFPSLNLEMTENPTIKTIPPQILFDNKIDSFNFGIVSQRVVDNIFYVMYDANYQNPYKATVTPNHWGYFVDNEGNIIDSFPLEKYAEKEANLIEQKRKDFFKQLADIVKQDYAMLQQFKQDPYNANIQTRALYKLKHYTGIANHTFKSENGSFSCLDIYKATINNNDPRLKYYTLNLKDILLNDYYDLLGKSTLSRQYLEFDEELILSFLTEEEKAFASTTYIPENDEIVFNAMYQEILKTGDYMVQMREVGINSFDEYRYDWYTLSQDMGNFTTNEQLIKYHKKYLEITSSDKIINGSGDDVYNMTNLEIKNLLAYIEQQVNDNPNIDYKDINFADYQHLFGNTFFEKIGIPTDLSEFTKNKDLTLRQNFFLDYALTTYILKGESNKLPLKEFFGSTSSTLYFTNIVKAKFEPFLLNRENYPQDTLEAVKTYNAIPNSVRNIEKIGFFVVDMIRSETDVKKSLKASIQFLEALKYENANITASLKNQLLDNSIIFDKSLPLIQRIGAYQQIAEVSGFADDYKIQNRLLKDFIEEIEAIKDPYERNAHYDIFINKKHRISDPDIRRKYQRLWVESAFAACGYKIDDNSPELHEKIKLFINKLHGTYKEKFWGEEKIEDNVNMADRLEIAKLLADKFVSQEELSMLIRPKPESFDEMGKGNRDNNSLLIAGFDTVKLVVAHKPSEASELIDFLLSKGSPDQCQQYASYLVKTLNDIFRYDTYVKKEISPETLQVLHREFWGYPLEARAVLINELLHSSSEISGQDRWEDIFKKVAPRIFPNADSDMSKIGTEFLHSYIKSRKDNERTLYLAAMMVAANENSETTDPEKSIAKGIRLFLENSGPAAVKLGQAMASYTDVPKFIRDEMQELKSNAARPSRWEIYEWLEFYKNKDNDNNLDFGKDVWLGQILGSASYFVTLEKGKFENGQIPFQTDKVTKILRAGAKIASDKEFGIFEKMLYDLAQKGIMKNGVDSFVRLVKQAKETVEIETDLNIGYSQLETAKKLYKEKEISTDGYTFKLHVADWPDFGKNWADLERAKGVDLDDISNPAYKKAVSKAYFTLELMNMLSGGKFDHDRHSKQLKIDTQTNTIGLFDTGAMAIVNPHEKDKELLGKVIYKTLQKTLDYSSNDGDKVFSRVGAILSSEIEKIYADKQTDSTYLTECQRGLLALTDFYKDLNAQDFTDCINSAINNQDMPIDKSIIRGFVKEGIKDIGIFESNQPLLSYKDKETLGALIFNVYASASVEGTQNLGQVIANQVQKLQQQGVDMPILNIISEKINDKSATSLGFNIPKEFMPTISAVVGQKNIDIAILKGIMKEAVSSVDLQGQKDNYSEKDRQELGKLIYDTFDLMVLESKNGHKISVADAFLRLQKNGQYQTELGLKIAAVVKTAAQIKSDAAGIDINEIVKASLLSGNMDKEIAKGISERFKEKNPNLILRTKLAKGLNMFLSQKTQDMSVVKKAIIKMLVKKPEAVKTAESELEKQIIAHDTGKKIVDMIKGYADKFARLIKQKEVNLSIKISDNSKIR